MTTNFECCFDDQPFSIDGWLRIWGSMELVSYFIFITIYQVFQMGLAGSPTTLSKKKITSCMFLKSEAQYWRMFRPKMSSWRPCFLPSADVTNLSGSVSRAHLEVSALFPGECTPSPSPSPSFYFLINLSKTLCCSFLVSVPARLMISPVQGDGDDERSMHLNSLRLMFSLTCRTTVKGSRVGRGREKGCWLQ